MKIELRDNYSRVVWKYWFSDLMCTDQVERLDRRRLYRRLFRRFEAIHQLRHQLVDLRRDC